MTKFSGDIGLQFTIHIANEYPVPKIVELTRLALDQGFDQVWVNDNLCHRNIFVVLAAIAAQVPIRLGSAILVPYFRNPIDLADSVASLTELTDGRELSIGIARGAHAIAGNQVTAEKPLATVRETVESVKDLIIQVTIIRVLVAILLIITVVLVNIDIVVEVMGHTVVILMILIPAIHAILVRINQVLIIHSLIAIKKVLAIQVNM